MAKNLKKFTEESEKQTINESKSDIYVTTEIGYTASFDKGKISFRPYYSETSADLVFCEDMHKSVKSQLNSGLDKVVIQARDSRDGDEIDQEDFEELLFKIAEDNTLEMVIGELTATVTLKK